MLGFRMGVIASSIGHIVTTTWNPADKNAGITLSSGNLVASRTVAGSVAVRATSFHNAGNRYFEITQNTGGTDMVAGVADSAAFIDSFLGNNASTNYRQSAGYWANGHVYKNINAAADISSLATYTNGDKIGIAVDFSAKTIKFYKNGTLIHTHTESGTLNALFPAVSLQNTSSCTLNCGPSFSFLPSGCVAWDS